MPHRSYQEFEIKGKISFENLVKVLIGLDSIDELSELLLPNDVELFESKDSSTKSATKQKAPQETYGKTFDIEIPDVFKSNS